jgi:hypothetical protein
LYWSVTEEWFLGISGEHVSICGGAWKQELKSQVCITLLLSSLQKLSYVILVFVSIVILLLIFS